MQNCYTHRGERGHLIMWTISCSTPGDWYADIERRGKHQPDDRLCSKCPEHDAAYREAVRELNRRFGYAGRMPAAS